MTREEFTKAVETEKNRLCLKTNAEAAEAMGLDPSTLSKALSGKIPITQNQLRGLKLLQLKSADELKDGPSSYSTQPHQFIRVELKSGNVFNLPIPPGPDGYERAVAAAAALDRASRGEQAATVRAVEALQATGAQVPVPPAADSR